MNFLRNLSLRQYSLLAFLLAGYCKYPCVESPQNNCSNLQNNWTYLQNSGLIYNSFVNNLNDLYTNNTNLKLFFIFIDTFWFARKQSSQSTNGKF